MSALRHQKSYNKSLIGKTLGEYLTSMVGDSIRWESKSLTNKLNMEAPLPRYMTYNISGG